MSETIEIFNYEIYPEKLIGKGQNGIVLECRHKTKKFNEELCVKIQNCSKDNTVDLETYREIQILKEIKNTQNQHIITTFDIFKNDGRYYIVMEKCKDGDLKQYIEKQKLKQQYFQASELLNFVYQFCEGYKTLAAHNILHRDIKSQNIFLNYQPFTLKIGDLGAGRILENAKVKGKYTSIGTPLYCSPQIFYSQEYSNKTDIYSLGMVLFELCYLTLPFQQRYDYINEFNERIQMSKFIILQNLPTPGNQEEKDEIKYLIENMIVFEEDQRLSWDDLFKRIENNHCYAQFKNQVNSTLLMSQISQKKESASRIFMSSCINNPSFKVSYIENNIKNSQETNQSPLRSVMRILLMKYQLLDQFLKYFQDAIQTQYLQLRPLEYVTIISSIFGFQNSLSQQINCINTGEMKLISQHIAKETEIFQKNEEIIELFQTLKTQQDDMIYNKLKDQIHTQMKNRNTDLIIQKTIELINKQKIKLQQHINLRQLLQDRIIDCLQFSNLLTFFCELHLQKKIERLVSTLPYGEIPQNFGLFIAIFQEVQNLEQNIRQIEFYRESKIRILPKLNWTQTDINNSILQLKEFLKQRK